MNAIYHGPDGDVAATVTNERTEGRVDLELADGTVLKKVWPGHEAGRVTLDVPTRDAEAEEVAKGAPMSTPAEAVTEEKPTALVVDGDPIEEESKEPQL